MPKLICTVCLSSLQNAYKFKVRCEANDLALRNFLLNREDANVFVEVDLKDNGGNGIVTDNWESKSIKEESELNCVKEGDADCAPNQNPGNLLVQ